MSVLRAIALVALISGAACSLWLTLRAGHNNPSIVLIILFAGWDLLPFAGLAWLWSRARSAATLLVALLVALGSPAVYGYAVFGPPRPQIASWFLMVPLASWILIGIAAISARSASPSR
jgi:hypothetical protein